jgi:Ser/Thr protein kinase RdoA (MazF antagonist)
LSSPPEAGVDFFRHGALPVPRVTIKDAERIAKSSFGLTVRAQTLGSQQDSNFLLVAAGGVAGVLKVANPVAGQVSRALRPFRHPGLDRVLQWDLRHADRVLTEGW